MRSIRSYVERAQESVLKASEKCDSKDHLLFWTDMMEFCARHRNAIYDSLHVPARITDPCDDHSCDPLRGKRMDSADAE